MLGREHDASDRVLGAQEFEELLADRLAFAIGVGGDDDGGSLDEDSLQPLEDAPLGVVEIEGVAQPGRSEDVGGPGRRRASWGSGPGSSFETPWS